MLVSGGKKIVFHETYSYETIYEYGCYEEPVQCVNWSFDSKYLIVIPTTGYPEVIRPCVKDAKVLQKIKVNGVTAATFFKKTHRYIALGCNNGQINVWDTKNQICHKKLASASSNINCLDISPTDSYLTAGCENGNIVLYGISTNQKIQSLNIKDSNRPVTAVHFSPKERGLVGATNDEGYVGIWDILKHDTMVYIAKKHSTICSGIALSPINSHFFVSVGYDRLICMYDLRVNHPICSRESDFALTSVDMSPDGLMMACGHRKGGVLIYDLRNNDKPLFEKTVHPGIVSTVAYDRELKTLNCTDENREISIELAESPNDKTQYNQDAPHDQLNNSFLTLYDNLPTSNTMPANTADDVKHDSFLQDLSSPLFKPLYSVIPSKGSPRVLTDVDTSLDMMTNIAADTYKAQRNLSVSSDQLDNSFLELYKSTPASEKSKITTEAKQTVQNIIADATEDIDNKETEISVMSDTPSVTCPEIISKSDLKKIIREFDNSLKRQSENVIQMINSHMLHLNLILCKQHVQLMSKIDPSNIKTTSADPREELEKLRVKNAELCHEINNMKAEREKYFSSTNINGNYENS